MTNYFYFSLLFITAASFAATKISLKDIDQLILNQNSEFKIKELELKSADRSTGALARSFLPKIDGEIGMENFKTAQYSELTQPVGKLQANINLYNGNRDELLEKYNIQNREVKKIDQLESKRNLLLEAKILFFMALSYERSLKIANEAVNTNQINLKFALNRIKNGFSSVTDKIDFEQNQLSLEVDLEKLQTDSKNNLIDLKFILGIKDEIELVDELDKQIDLSFVPIANQENFLEFKKINLLSQIKHLEMNSIASWWKPSVDIYSEFIQYNQRDRDFINTSDRSDIVLGIKLTFNLFDGGTSYTRKEVAAIDASIQEENANLEKVRTLANFEKNSNLLSLSKKLLKNAQDNVAKTNEYYINTFSEYKRGVKNSPDVLQASQRYYLAKIKLVEVLRDNNIQYEKIKTYL